MNKKKVIENVASLFRKSLFVFNKIKQVHLSVLKNVYRMVECEYFAILICFKNHKRGTQSTFFFFSTGAIGATREDTCAKDILPKVYDCPVLFKLNIKFI